MGMFKTLINSLEHRGHTERLKKLIEAFFQHEYQLTLAYFKVGKKLDNLKNSSEQIAFMQKIVIDVESILKEKQIGDRSESFYSSGIEIKNLGKITVRLALMEFHASVRRVQSFIHNRIFVGALLNNF